MSTLPPPSPRPSSSLLDYPLPSSSISAHCLLSASSPPLPPAPPPFLPPSSPETMSSYLQSLASSSHASSVTTRSALPSSPSLYFWTYRPTNSDVLSVLNTVAAASPGGEPGSPGAGRAGRLSPATLRAERAGSSVSQPVFGRGAGGVGGFKVSAYKSPLESLASLGTDEHERFNRALRDERREFLARAERRRRSEEQERQGAATRIQQQARAYVCRRRFWGPGPSGPGLSRAKLARRGELRGQLRGLFRELRPGSTLTARAAAERARGRREGAAVTAQCRWRVERARRRVRAVREAK